jgi:hypothetical protein
MLEVRLNRIDPSRAVAGLPIPQHDYPSRLHPRHTFSVGRFTSDSQPSGFNAVMRKIVGEDLYTILGFSLTTPTFFRPEWQSVRSKIAEIRQKLAQQKQDYGGFYKAHAIHTPHVADFKPTTEKQAIETFRLGVRESSPSFDKTNFISEKGEFFLSSPLKVVAALPASTPGVSCYLIAEDDLTWHLEALDIIEETADYVETKEKHGILFNFCWNK